MSSMDNHRRRSRRGNRMKRGAFGSMARKPVITPPHRQVRAKGIREMLRMLAGHGRESRAVKVPAESAAEEFA